MHSDSQKRQLEIMCIYIIYVYMCIIYAYIYIYIHIQDAYHIIYYIMLVILIDPIRIYNWNNLKNSCWVATFAQSKHRIRAIYFAIVSMAWCPRYCPDTFSHNSTPLKSPDHLPKVDLGKGCSWMALTDMNEPFGLGISNQVALKTVLPEGT